MTNERPRVCIIGGGLSGLATAAHLSLAANDIDLTLIEASQRVGGVINTTVHDGFVIDHGADMFATKPSPALDLCKRLGVEDQLIVPKTEGRGAMILCRGQLVPIPDGFVLMRPTKLLSMLTTPLLSPAGKLRLLRERFIGDGGFGDQDVSVAEFVRHRLGEEVLQRIVGPLVAGIYTADIEKLSLHATMQPIYQMVRQHGSLAAATFSRKRSGQDSVERGSKGARYGQFRSFAGGMQGLIDAIAGTLPAGTIRTSHQVSRIRPTTSPSGQSTWKVLSPAGWQTFDRLVVATPAAVTASLVHEVAPGAAIELASIQCASTAIAVIVVRRSDIKRPAKTFGFVVPPCENRRILAGSFASEKFDGRADDDHVIIRCFIGGSLQCELLQNDDDQLIQIARDELSDLIGLSGVPVTAKVVRWNNAMPQYHVGHLNRVARIKESIAKVPGLTMTSNALDGVGIAPLIGTAKATADQVLESLR